MLVFGKKLGALVMLFDMAKAFLAVWCAKLIAPLIAWLPLAAGLFAVLGHCFPFYLKFKGGKGLAAFAGVVLAYRPTLFLFLLITGVVLMLIANYTFILPFYAAAFFAAYVAIRDGSIIMTVFATSASALVVIMHFGNFKKAIAGKERKVRDFIKKSH